MMSRQRTHLQPLATEVASAAGATKDHPLGVVIIDAVEVVRDWNASLFAADTRFDLVAAVASPGELRHAPTDISLDLAVFDLAPSGGFEESQLEAIREWTHGAALLVLTEDTEAQTFLRCLRAGVAGYLLKARTPAWLLMTAAYLIGRSLATVYDSHVATARPAADNLTGFVFRVGELPEMRLSEREAQVLSLLVRGMTDKQIAAELVLARSTVQTHVGNLLQKTGATNRVQLGAFSSLLGILPDFSPG